MSELQFPLQFKRQYSGPLDPDLTFTTTADLTGYLSSPLRYAGQIVTCLDQEGELLILNNAMDAWLPVSGTSDVSASSVSYDNTLAPNITANDVQDALTQLDLILNSLDISFANEEIVFGTGTGLTSDPRLKYTNGGLQIEYNSLGSFLVIERDAAPNNGLSTVMDYGTANGAIFTKFDGWNGSAVSTKFTQGIAFEDNNSGSAPWDHIYAISVGGSLNTNNALEIRNDMSTRLLGNVTVEGNLIVNGDQFITNTESVSAQDNQIVINAGEVGAGVTSGVAGIRVDRGSEPFYDIQFREADDVFVIGVSGDYQTVATREDNFVLSGKNGYYFTWNDTERRLDSTSPETVAADISGFLNLGSNTELVGGTGIGVSELSTDIWTVSVTGDYITSSEVASISADLDSRIIDLSGSYVQKTGDTMTGDLNIDVGDLRVTDGDLILESGFIEIQTEGLASNSGIQFPAFAIYESTTGNAYIEGTRTIIRPSISFNDAFEVNAGLVKVYGTTDSSGLDTGHFRVMGGASISKKLYIGTDLTLMSLAGNTDEIVTLDANGKLQNSGLTIADISGGSVTTLIGGSGISAIESPSDTWTVSVTGDYALQSVVDTISGDLDTLETQVDGITGGLIQLDDRYLGQNGVVSCSIGQDVYTISHNETTDYPVVSLVVPVSGSAISVLGVFNKTNTSFDVILSEAPSDAGYKISWALSSGNGGNSGGSVTTLTAGTGISVLEAPTDTWTVSVDGATLGSRTLLSDTTSTLADGISGTLDLSGYKGYALYSIETSHASWVRVYTDSASRTADAGRSEFVDPASDAGVIAETITTGAQTILLSPGVIGFNNENPVTSIIPVSVTNRSGGNAAITVTLKAIQLEA